MISEDFFRIRHRLEDLFNTHNCIEMDLQESAAMIEILYNLEEQIIALENAIVPENVRKGFVQEQANVVRLDLYSARRKGA